MRARIAWAVAAAVGGAVGLMMRTIDGLEDALRAAVDDLSR